MPLGTVSRFTSRAYLQSYLRWNPCFSCVSYRLTAVMHSRTVKSGNPRFCTSTYYLFLMFIWYTFRLWKETNQHVDILSEKQGSINRCSCNNQPSPCSPYIYFSSAVVLPPSFSPKSTSVVHLKFSVIVAEASFREVDIPRLRAWEQTHVGHAHQVAGDLERLGLATFCDAAQVTLTLHFHHQPTSTVDRQWQQHRGEREEEREREREREKARHPDET